MVKELKPKTDKLESVKDANPNLRSNEKSLNPKKDNSNGNSELNNQSTPKDLNPNDSSNNENQSVPDGPPQLDSSGVDDGSYMDGFTDDASGWMADKLEDGLDSVKDKLKEGLKGLGSNNEGSETETSDPSSGSDNTSDPSSGNNEQSNLSAEGETSEAQGNDGGSEPGKDNDDSGGDSEQGSVDSQNSSNNGDAMSIDVGDDDPDDEGSSETTLDKIKNFAKNALFKNKAIKVAVHSFNFLVSALSSTGMPAAAAAAVVSASLFGTVAVVGVTGAAIVASDGAAKDDKVVKVENCDDKEKAADAALAAGVDGLTTAEQEENVKKIHSALREWGLTDIQIAGVVGNGEQESGLDPKKFESDFVAGGKYKTEENYEKTRKDGPLVENIFGSWSTFAGYYGNKGLNEPGYREGAPEGKHTLGVGVWQWTGNGTMGLWKYAKDKGVDMWSIDTQLKFMLSSFKNGSSYYHRLEKYRDLKSSNPEQAALDFLNNWEYGAGTFTPNDGTHALAEKRMQYAAKWYVKIKEMQVDKNYAKSILDAVVHESAAATSAKIDSTSEDYHDCVNDNVGFGGTGWQKKGGKFSGANGSNLNWTYTELPDELKQYAIDPRSLGMKFGELSEGWTLGGDGYVNAGYCNQCTSLSSSLTGVLWEKDGKPLASKHGMHGNGQDIVRSMAYALGVKIRKEPISGDVFSQVGGKYGHTGIVSHVFENGDILVIEQNYGGKSGGSRFGDYESLDKGKYEWSYRYIPKSVYERDHEFASPEGAGYKISSKAKSMK